MVLLMKRKKPTPHEAIKMALRDLGKVSAPYLQRKCKISYRKALDEIAEYKKTKET